MRRIGYGSDCFDNHQSLVRDWRRVLVLVHYRYRFPKQKQILRAAYPRGPKRAALRMTQVKVQTLWHG